MATDLDTDTEEMLLLREQFIAEFDLRRVGSGSAKEVYCTDTDDSRVVVLFCEDLSPRDALVEALLESFWAHVLCRKNVVLPHDPEWRIHFYTSERRHENMILRTLGHRDGERAGGRGAAGGAATAAVVTADDTAALARALEAEAVAVTRRHPRPANMLVYCTTNRAECDMHNWLAHERPSRSAAVCALRQVVAQLRAMHALDVVHGDVKCSNVLVLDSRSGLVQLCDFALANKRALVKPLYTTEDARWLGRQGGSYQLNLPEEEEEEEDDEEQEEDDEGDTGGGRAGGRGGAAPAAVAVRETPLQYGVRNDWLGLCLVAIRVRAAVDARDSKHLLDRVLAVERPFWHTVGATREDYAALRRFASSMALADTDEATAAASDIVRAALTDSEPPPAAPQPQPQQQQRVPTDAARADPIN